MENVRVKIDARISAASANSWQDGTTLVEVKREECGLYSLQEAMDLLRAMADAVINRCGGRMDQRICDAQRRLTVNDDG